MEHRVVVEKLQVARLELHIEAVFVCHLLDELLHLLEAFGKYAEFRVFFDHLVGVRDIPEAQFLLVVGADRTVMDRWMPGPLLSVVVGGIHLVHEVEQVRPRAEYLVVHSRGTRDGAEASHLGCPEAQEPDDIGAVRVVAELLRGVVSPGHVDFPVELALPATDVANVGE
jgi:hypothetical protein